MKYCWGDTMRCEVFLVISAMPLYKAFLVLFFSFVVSGCSSMTWKNAGDSFIRAAKEPMTWVNAGAAAVIYTAGKDQEISEKLSRDTPVFGSREGAQDYSDKFRSVTSISMNASALLVNDSESDRKFLDKTYRVLGNNISAGFVATSTGDWQGIFERKRPDGEPGSMPSAHTSRAFACAYFANKNYENSHLYSPVSSFMSFITYTSAYLTGYARVEGKKHYPTDVFMGAAYGSFVPSFIYHFTDNFGLGNNVVVSFNKIGKYQSIEFVYLF